jgi:hypothetical protein
MKLKKFNEIHFQGGNYENGDPHSYTQVDDTKPMKKFVLTTTSESSDHYIYFIEHPEKPTQEELEKFLVEQGSDTYDGYSHENIDRCVEIKDFKRL